MRTFHSLDPFVQLTIENCTSSALPTSLCADILRCIINNVDNATTGRWSAGSSILALIPTATSFTSISIDELVLLSEESPLLAVGAALVSVSTFTPRFFDIKNSSPRTEAAEKEFIAARIAELYNLSSGFRWQRWRIALVATSIFYLLGGIAMLWAGVYPIVQNGVIIWSCPVRAHVPIWVALSQALTLLNVLCREVLFEREEVGCVADRRSETRLQTRRSLLLRCPKKTYLARGLRTFTALLQLALYLFGTASLGSMTMYPASDAVFSLSLLTAGSAVARGVFGAMSEEMFRRKIVVDVQSTHMRALREFAMSMI